MATATVRARSCAEMPVVMPSRASIETVKAVSWREEFEAPEVDEGFSRVDVLGFARREDRSEGRVLLLAPGDLQGSEQARVRALQGAGFHLAVVGWGSADARARAEAEASAFGATAVRSSVPCW